MSASELAEGEQSIVAWAKKDNASPEEGRLSVDIAVIFSNYRNERGRRVSTSSSRTNKVTSKQGVPGLQVS